MERLFFCMIPQTISGLFKNEYKQAMEQASMLDICAKEKNVLYISYITYLRDMDENQPYAKNQTDLFRTFWLPFLAELQTQYETVPVFIQYHLMHVLKGFIEQNMADLEKLILIAKWCFPRLNSCFHM